MLQVTTLEITPQIESRISRIFVLSETLKHLPVLPELLQRVFHTQYLKSSLFSARIEGNTLKLEELESVNQPDGGSKEKREVNNVMRALTLLPRWTENLSIITLQEVHTIILDKVSADAGKLRREQTAIFDAFGNAVYLTPDRNTMDAMLDAFIDTFNTIDTDKNALLALAPLHLFFEKTHPFADGNGRVGRILLHLLLSRFEIAPKNVVLPIDQYFEKQRDKYYFYLEQSNKTIQDFEEFLLDGIIWGFEQMLDEIRDTKLPEKEGKTLNLLPRRHEILEIINDHPFCTLDLIARRFPTIPRRTLGFDVNDLLKKKLIVKNGTTRGVTYSASE